MCHKSSKICKQSNIFSSIYYHFIDGREAKEAIYGSEIAILETVMVYL
jgi:hypothetical protein